jgi:hypothetical protein
MSGQLANHAQGCVDRQVLSYLRKDGQIRIAGQLEILGR